MAIFNALRRQKSGEKDLALSGLGAGGLHPAHHLSHQGCAIYRGGRQAGCHGGEILMHNDGRPQSFGDSFRHLRPCPAETMDTKTKDPFWPAFSTATLTTVAAQERSCAMSGCAALSPQAARPKSGGGGQPPSPCALFRRARTWRPPRQLGLAPSPPAPPSRPMGRRRDRP